MYVQGWSQDTPLNIKPTIGYEVQVSWDTDRKDIDD